MTRKPEPGLYLITPVIADADAFAPVLAEACAAGGITAVLIRLAPADERTLVNRVKRLAPIAQAQEAAAILADPGGGIDLAAAAVRGGADGAHADDPDLLRELCRRLKDGRNVGAGGLRSRHDAMVAGELGVDYVMFGEPGPDGRKPSLDLIEERADWWAEIFQLPCVVVAPDFGSLPTLAATGADFVGLGALVWDHPEGPRAALAAARAALRNASEPAA